MSELRPAPGSALRVWTYKDPSTVLARFAHDLCFEARGFALTVREEAEQLEVELRVDPRALALVGSARDGGLTPVKPKDQAEIERTARDKVLEVGRYGEVVFRGRGPAEAVAGTLTLHGRDAPLTVVSVRDGARWTGEVELTPSRWGIKPYRAFLGALKLADRVKVSWELELA